MPNTHTHMYYIILCIYALEKKYISKKYVYLPEIFAWHWSANKLKIA